MARPKTLRPANFAVMTTTVLLNLANADHLGVLHAIWAAETRGARDDRYRELVMAALPAGHRRPLSYQARWLFRTLHAAELAGLDPAEVTRTAIASRDLAGAHYHRRRPQSAGVARVPLASPWVASGMSMSLNAFGREYTDGDGLAHDTSGLARRVLARLAVTMKALRDRVMATWQDVHDRAADSQAP